MLDKTIGQIKSNKWKKRSKTEKKNWKEVCMWVVNAASRTVQRAWLLAHLGESVHGVVPVQQS